MRHGFRWVATLLVLALMLPAAAGAVAAPKASVGSQGWNPWSRLVAVISALFGTDQGSQKKAPQVDASCGFDPNGAPKCDS